MLNMEQKNNEELKDLLKGMGSLRQVIQPLIQSLNETIEKTNQFDLDDLKKKLSEPIEVNHDGKEQVILGLSKLFDMDSKELSSLRLSEILDKLQRRSTWK